MAKRETNPTVSLRGAISALEAMLPKITGLIQATDMLIGFIEDDQLTIEQLRRAVPNVKEVLEAARDFVLTK